MIDHVLRFVLPATRAVLPPSMMESPRAWAMLLAIGLQESKFLERRQRDHGPARGFWQFERGGGTKAVITHPSTRELAAEVLRDLRYAHLIDKTREIHYTLHDNDVLACAFARLLLWTVPGQLPSRDNAVDGWRQYLEGWRPGAHEAERVADAPPPSVWRTNYQEAWYRLERSWRTVSNQREWSE